MFDDFETDEHERELQNDAEGPCGLLPPRQMLECFGHSEVEKKLLELEQNNRLPHAIIFSGLKGIGKSTMAYRFIRYLMAQGEGQDTDTGGLFGDDLSGSDQQNMDVPSGHSCVTRISAGAHPDLFVVERPYDEKKDALKENIDVETVRRVEPFMRMTASQGGWRIVLIDDADSMNRNAQNAILKILEEPPEQSLLILVAHRPGAIIPTIRSRCRKIQFQPLSREDFNRLIALGHGNIREQELDTLYQLSGGSVGKAGQILEEGGLEVVDKILVSLHRWPDWDWVEIHRLADSLSKKGQEKALHAFEDVFLWIIQALLQSKARHTALPSLLKNDVTERMLEHYDLIQWINMYGSLYEHIESVHNAHLDKRQSVLGVFSILSK